ncbi:sigma factor-like helix-turn-helix DNA-binding protein [Glaciihabitans sp. UYNi722]|uniref:sigma factor-like helix-turn-helix DNA-binding protein n=1 Tax=Glaciihabitans sp. UYNi722 TaxID=3156344 RepID=UPI0033912AE0
MEGLTIGRRETIGHREVIDLAYIQGLTLAEIAERVGAPVGTGKTRLRDGLIALRQHMNVAA